MDKETAKIITKKALHILITENGVQQNEIQKKIQTLDLSISKSSISNLYNNKNTGYALQRKAAKCLLQILEKEYCLSFDAAQNKFVGIVNCIPEEIIGPEENALVDNLAKPDSYIIHDGRRDVHDKVALYNHAKKEVIEIGIRLKNFSSYFDEKRESAFMEPLQNLLARGVYFKCYVLNPKGNCARRYIDDRAIVQVSEANLLEDIPRITQHLKSIFIELNRGTKNGKLELYQYDHFPCFHATIIDGNDDHAWMNIAPYLYGVSRANTPVIELKKKNNKKLFKKYWRSVNAIIQSQQVIQLV